MRVWTWMLGSLLAVGLVACGPEPKPPVPEDEVTTEQPEIDVGTLIEDPGTPTTTGDDGTGSKTDSDSEAPPFDRDSEAPAFDPDASGDESPNVPADPPPIDGSSTNPQTQGLTKDVLADATVAELAAHIAQPSTRDNAADVIRDRGPAAVPELLTALDDTDWQVRAGAVFALSLLGEDAQKALPKLRTMAKHEQHESVRDAAVWAIDALGE
jgi:hypothetical protein